MRRAVVCADFSLRQIAPEMTGRYMLAFFFGERFMRRRAGEHFLGAKMFANRIHGQATSLSSARRINACAIGTL